MSESVVGSTPNAGAPSLESDVGGAAAGANDGQLPADLIAALSESIGSMGFRPGPPLSVPVTLSPEEAPGNDQALNTGAAYDAFDAADAAAGATDGKLTEEEALAHGFVYKDLDGNGFLDRGDVNAADWADKHSNGTVDELINKGEAEWAGAEFSKPNAEGLMSVKQPLTTEEVGRMVEGLSLADAEAAAADAGLQLRVVTQDGVGQQVTRDYQSNRYNVVVTDGKVTSVSSNA